MSIPLHGHQTCPSTITFLTSIPRVLTIYFHIFTADVCTSDDGYVRWLSLFLNALVLEVEAVADASDTVKSQSLTCKNLAKTVCHLIVRSATASPTEVDMVQEAMDILTENLQDEFLLGKIVTDAFLAIARAPASSSNRGHYVPALILAFHMYRVSPPPPAVPEEDRKWKWVAENSSDSFRHDVVDLFGRRVFALGGSVNPATPEEIMLAAPLIMELTKEEFDGAILRALKFKLTSSPQDTMCTLAAFVDVLSEAGNGTYVDAHLGGGTNIVGIALNQITTENGMVGAAKVMAALAKASPAKGAVAVTDAMTEKLRNSSAKGISRTATLGLCLGLEAVARGLLYLMDDGIEDDIWRELSEDVAIPALEDMGGYDGVNSAAPWYVLAGLDPPRPCDAYTHSDELTQNEDSTYYSDAQGEQVATTSAPSLPPHSEPGEEKRKGKAREKTVTFTTGKPDLLDNRITAKHSTFDDIVEKADLERDNSYPRVVPSHEASRIPDFKRGIDDADYCEYDEEAKLSIAIAVSPNEEAVFIPEAIEYNPDAKPSRIKNRRFRFYTAMVAIILVIMIVGIAVGAIMNASKAVENESILSRPSLSPTLVPTPAFYVDAVGDTIFSLVGDKMFDSGTPYSAAAEWIAKDDPMQLVANDRNIAQRYLLAMLFFTWNGLGWNECVPTDDPDDVECKATCFEAVYAEDDFECDRRRWLSNSHECEWLGVFCSDDGAVVKGLELIGNNLRGTIPTEITSLDHLEQLSLIENFISGTIPSDLGKMRYLMDIELTFNELTGTIPNEIFESRNLFRFGVYKNALDGTVPTNIGKISALEGLHLGDNAFVGTIPTEIGQITNLHFAEFNENLLYGKIPTEISQLKEIRSLLLGNNDLSGIIPDEIGDLAQLEELMISGNRIAGWIPDQFYDLANLKYFWAQDNKLSGTISPQVIKLKSIEDFTIRGNYFSGTIPSEFSNLRNLTELWLHFNDFVGSTSIDFCDKLDQGLEDFFTDCAREQPGDLPPRVLCECCTHCCDHISKCFDN